MLSYYFYIHYLQTQKKRSFKSALYDYQSFLLNDFKFQSSLPAKKEENERGF